MNKMVDFPKPRKHGYEFAILLEGNVSRVVSEETAMNENRQKRMPYSEVSAPCDTHFESPVEFRRSIMDIIQKERDRVGQNETLTLKGLEHVFPHSEYIVKISDVMMWESIDAAKNYLQRIRIGPDGKVIDNMK